MGSTAIINLEVVACVRVHIVQPTGACACGLIVLIAPKQVVVRHGR